MKFNIKKTISEDLSAREIIKIILENRNIDDIASFLSPQKVGDIDFADLFEPGYFENSIKLTLEALKKAKDLQKKILLWGDYDADGITGTAILWKALRLLGFEVQPHIPLRSNGYGFNNNDLDALKSKYDPALIITIDHGIMGHDGIDYGGTLGIPVIVTDHHTKGKSDPNALVIFHTSLVSGSCVSYFFAREIARNLTKDKKILDLFDGEFLALASIGLIADMVPLVDIARSIAKYGLEQIAITQNLGLQELLLISGLQNTKSISTYHVGFQIAPRLNAIGRLGDAMDSLRLLCTTNKSKASEYAKYAQEVNTNRQELVDKYLKIALYEVDSNQSLIIYRNDLIHEGIIGLISGKITQNFVRPSLVFTCRDGVCKASARSLEGIDITQFLHLFDDLLTSCGGHTAAAGCSVPEIDFEKFVKTAQKKALELFDKKLFVSTTKVDAELPLCSLTKNLCDEIENLSPFGIGNANPIFATKAKIKSFKPTKNPKISQFVLQSGSIEIGGVDFNAQINAKNIGQEHMLAYKLSLDTFLGKNVPKVELVALENDD